MRFKRLLAWSAAVALPLASASSGRICSISAATSAAANSGSASAGYDRQAAARYLDSRQAWWQGWDRAQKDHGTLCISCHTQAPYGLARPLLSRALDQQDPTSQEQVMLASIKKRVQMWNEVVPFYSDALYGTGKEIESRNAEAVLNAIILSSYDAARLHLSKTTRLAFDHAWALQSTSGPDAGAWVWQNFDFTPWESKESQYYWAAQMAAAVGSAADSYRTDREVIGNLAALRVYLLGHYDAQPLLNKVVVLLAAAQIPTLLTPEQRKSLIRQIAACQRDDGGWSLTDLGTWQRRDKTPLETRSDGFATGIVILALEQNRISNAYVQRGLHWLESNQDKATGAWHAWSLNRDRDPNSNAGPFMSDAATGYAVLALEAHNHRD